MKNQKIVTIFAFFWCTMAFIFTIFDFLALHDIRQDYVSQNILNFLQISISKELPNWTTTSGEWQLVNISMVLRFFFFIFMLSLLLNSIKMKKPA